MTSDFANTRKTNEVTNKRTHNIICKNKSYLLNYLILIKYIYYSCELIHIPALE